MATQSRISRSLLLYATFTCRLYRNLPPLETFESEKLMTAVLDAAGATGIPLLANLISNNSLLGGYFYADVSKKSYISS
jgi:hypothetical protein